MWTCPRGIGIGCAYAARQRTAVPRRSGMVTRALEDAADAEGVSRQATRPCSAVARSRSQVFHDREANGRGRESRQVPRRRGPLMKVFVDTSGLHAMLVVDDAQHAHAAAAFARLLEARAEFGRHRTSSSRPWPCCTAGRPPRCGRWPSRSTAAQVWWVSPAEHAAGVRATIEGGDAGPSFVDQVSFRTMQAQGIRVALAFDQHFRRAGFEIAPP